MPEPKWTLPLVLDRVEESAVAVLGASGDPADDPTDPKDARLLARRVEGLAKLLWSIEGRADFEERDETPLGVALGDVDRMVVLNGVLVLAVACKAMEDDPPGNMFGIGTRWSACSYGAQDLARALLEWVEKHRGGTTAEDDEDEDDEPEPQETTPARVKGWGKPGSHDHPDPWLEGLACDLHRTANQIAYIAAMRRTGEVPEGATGVVDVPEGWPHAL